MVGSSADLPLILSKEVKGVNPTTNLLFPSVMVAPQILILLVQVRTLWELPIYMRV